MLILIVFILSANAYAKTIEELYQEGDYKKLIEFANSAELTKEQCYYIGYGYFRLEDDANAIKMYNLAIKNGLDNDNIFLFKGLSFYYSGQYKKAIENYRIAIKKNPIRQKNYTELGNVYYLQKQYDSALVYFYKAREQKFELGDSYLKIPTIYHNQKQFDKALEEYKISASLIDKSDPAYIDIILNIGLLEYTNTKNYANSVAAYSELLSIVPDKYDFYPKLIKACYANEEYSRGDSVFNILKLKYDKKELPESMMEIPGAVVDEFLWKGQRVSAMKYYKKPEKFAEPIYQFFLIDKTGEKIEKKILTEKMNDNISGGKHVLCGKDPETGTHFTYSIGWKTDDIDYKKLKQYVFMILNDEMKPGASSNMGTSD